MSQPTLCGSLTEVSRSNDASSGYPLVLCDPLCFIFLKYSQIPNKSLKSIFSDFYTCDPICSSKETLLKFVDKINSDKWVRPPKRRKDSKKNIGNKLRQDIDDILSTIMFIDERNVRSKLPVFVAADPDMLPSVKLTDGDLACVINKLSNIDTTLNTVKSEILAGMVSGFARASEHANDASVRNNQPAFFHRRHLQDVSATSQPTGPALQHPAVQFLRRNTTVNSNSRPLSTSGGDDLTSDDGLEDTNGMQVVVNNRKKHKISQVASYASAVSTNPPRQTDAPKPFSSKSTSNTARRKPLVGGSTSCSLKAATTLQIKKKVYRLGNIDSSYTCADVTEYITSLGVRVTSCFALPRRDNQPSNNTNYRICVFATDANKLFVKDNWYSGITLQEWVFKPKGTTDLENFVNRGSEGISNEMASASAI